jgi:hypothetical protein
MISTTLSTLGELFAAICWMRGLILLQYRSWRAMRLLLLLLSMIGGVRGLNVGRFRIWGFRLTLGQKDT